MLDADSYKYAKQAFSNAHMYTETHSTINGVITI